MLQPLDLLVCLKFLARGGARLGYEELAAELKIGLGGAHRAVGRSIAAGLLTPQRLPNRAALLEFILHGVRYAYYVQPGPATRGMPTAHAAPPLSGLITPGDSVPVWPDKEGSVRGSTIAPLHKSVPEAARQDQALYELLALVDAIRIGRARERQLAQKELELRLKA